MSLSFGDSLITCTLEDQHTVLTTVTNSGYILYTLNLLKSLRPYGLDQKVLCVCMDRTCAERLRQKGYHAITVENEKEIGHFCPWNTKGYDRICYWKLVLIYRLLQENRNVVLMDGDLVFLRNPMDALLKWSSEVDIWCQNDSERDSDHTNLCTGYMWIRSTDTTKALYDCVSPTGQRNYQQCAFDNNDQSYFNRFIKPYCTTNVLPLSEYPNGNVFYRNPSLSDTATMVHFNWVHGHHKMAKMKEHRLWLLTEEEEEE